MSAEDVAAALRAAVAPIRPPLPLLDPDKVPTSQRTPYAVLHLSPATPGDRSLSGAPIVRTATHRVVAVSNNAGGARIVADTLVDAFDQLRVDGGLLTVELVSDPLRDDTDLSAVLWSSTLEIRHHR